MHDKTNNIGKLKILITTDHCDSAVNGVVTSINNLKKELTNMGHEVRTLTLSENVHSHKKDGVYYVSSISADKIYQDVRVRIRAGKGIIDDIIEWEPDIVHSQCEFSTFHYGKKIAEKLEIPFVHTYHTVYEDYTHYFCPSKRLGKTVIAKFSKMIAGKTDCVIAPSVKVKEMLEKYGVSSLIKVIPTGIERERFLAKPSDEWIRKKRSEMGISDDRVTLIFVGRLAKEKNISEILNYFSKLSRLNLAFVIVGDGPEKEELEKVAKKLKIDKDVHFTGMVSSDEVKKYYHLGDLFVNASTSETQGLTYIEALASGVPLLCRKDSCLDNIVENGVNGWQYQTFEEFNDAVNEFISNAKLREEMHFSALEKSKEFTSLSFARKVERLYYELIENKKYKVRL